MIARFYRSLYRIRRVEEDVARVYPSDAIKSPVHLSIGQEAVSVGVCEALAEGDVVFGTYRGHALYLAKGGDLGAMIAELYGKETGCARGRGGCMHLVDPDAGMMATSAVVGTTIPNAVGYAYALKLRREHRIVASFFGDGAVEEGVFTESLNFAALKELPLIFVCENNGYAIHTHQRQRQRAANICERVSAHGIRAERIEGFSDLFRIHERVAAAAHALRAGEADGPLPPGPYFFECMTYRYLEHVGPNEDFHLGYRSREEAEPWIASDPLGQLASMLPADERERIETQVEAEIRKAFAFAEESLFPQPDTLHAHTFGGA